MQFKVLSERSPVILSGFHKVMRQRFRPEQNCLHSSSVQITLASHPKNHITFRSESYHINAGTLLC